MQARFWVESVQVLQEKVCCLWLKDEVAVACELGCMRRGLAKVEIKDRIERVEEEGQILFKVGSHHLDKVGMHPHVVTFDQDV